MWAIATVAVFNFLLMMLVWCIARRINNPSLVDVAWGIGLMISGMIYLFSTTLTWKSCVLILLISIWGLRLSGYLLITRIRKGIIDKRYIKLSESWKKISIGYLLNYQFQAILILIISSSFYFIAQVVHREWNLLDYAGFILCIIGIAGESFADYQLQLHKRKNLGNVCDIGLWYYSRHPNYFFDWLTWCGFAFFGLSAQHGWAAIISPLILFIVMTKITGPITERGSVESRGEVYLKYQRTTSMFFPWFKFSNNADS